MDYNQLKERVPEPTFSLVQESINRSFKNRTLLSALYQGYNPEQNRAYKPVFDKVIPYGPVNAKRAIFNTFPAPRDISSGVPFSDYHGYIFLGYLSHLKIDREDVYMSSVVKSDDYLNLPNDQFSDHLYEWVASYLFQELSQIDATHILFMGERTCRVVKEMLNQSSTLTMEQIRSSSDTTNILGRQATFYYTYDSIRLMIEDDSNYSNYAAAIWNDLNTFIDASNN